MRARHTRRHSVGHALRSSAAWGGTIAVLALALGSTGAQAASSAGSGATAHPLTLSTATATASAVTRSGSGRFADLKVTVDQTKSLIDQVVHISWTGGTTTQPANGNFATDFLQVFQCWGDDAAGPDRTQCQFGGLVGDSRAAQNITSRQINNSLTLVDPAESIIQPDATTNVYVPFHSITGEKVTDPSKNSYYDAYSTNELPLARTRADGGGEAFMELQTGEEAPGLGCGVRLSVGGGAKKLHRCWLVVVPRDETEVDGSTVAVGGQLLSSPLSQTNWDQRLIFPLTFLPVDLSCPLGAKERQTEGQESVAEAVGRWQSTLCAKTSAVFGYSQVTDEMARGQLEEADPGLVFVSTPAPSADFPHGYQPVYAPVALSGLTIAFNVQKQSSAAADDAVRQEDGKRVTSMKLNARLVAKLITQSYRRAVVGNQDYLATNASNLTADPEFLALNPDFAKGFYSPGVPDVLVPLSGSDAISVLWRWIASDADAAAFIAGTADPSGMVVNPKYKGMSLKDLADLPKSDVSCLAATEADDPDLCESDYRPYANDMHDAARSASRGDTLSRSQLDRTVTPPVYKKGALQPDGSRAVLALTDTATAARYGLVTAELENASGAFVAPTTKSLTAGLKAMKATKIAGVLKSDPATTDQAAYPLTTLTYAATVPGRLSASERRDVAAFVRYAVGAGQTPGLEPGTLPDGYVPLTASLRTAARAAAKAVTTWKAPRSSSTTTDDTPDTSSGDDPGTTPTTPADDGVPATTPQPADAGTPTTGTTTALAVQRTAAVDLGPRAHSAVSDAVLLGAAGALLGPFATWFARRRRRA